MSEQRHTALAAFALLLANHIGDDKVVHAAIVSVRQTLKDYPEAPKLGANDPDRKQFQVGGALEFLAQDHRGEAGADHPRRITS